MFRTTHRHSHRCQHCRETTASELHPSHRKQYQPPTGLGGADKMFCSATAVATAGDEFLVSLSFGVAPPTATIVVVLIIIPAQTPIPDHESCPRGGHSATNDGPVGIDPRVLWAIVVVDASRMTCVDPPPLLALSSIVAAIPSTYDARSKSRAYVHLPSIYALFDLIPIGIVMIVQPL